MNSAIGAAGDGNRGGGVDGGGGGAPGLGEEGGDEGKGGGCGGSKGSGGEGGRLGGGGGAEGPCTLGPTCVVNHHAKMPMPPANTSKTQQHMAFQ